MLFIKEEHSEPERNESQAHGGMSVQDGESREEKGASGVLEFFYQNLHVESEGPVEKWLN